MITILLRYYLERRICRFKYCNRKGKLLLLLVMGLMMHRLWLVPTSELLLVREVILQLKQQILLW